MARNGDTTNKMSLGWVLGTYKMWVMGEITNLNIDKVLDGYYETNDK